MTVHSLLVEAAELAGRQKSVKRAVEVGWSALHRETPEIMLEAFKAWAISEGITPRSSSITSHLSTAVRRRSKSPGDVQGSLLRASTRVDDVR